MRTAAPRSDSLPPSGAICISHCEASVYPKTTLASPPLDPACSGMECNIASSNSPEHNRWLHRTAGLTMLQFGARSRRQKRSAEAVCWTKPGKSRREAKGVFGRSIPHSIHPRLFGLASVYEFCVTCGFSAAFIKSCADRHSSRSIHFSISPCSSMRANQGARETVFTDRPCPIRASA